MITKKILIVEDDFAITEMFRQKLVLEGFEVEIAHNGEVALERLKSYKPDLVLLDIMMPGIDGLNVLGRIRTNIETRNTLVIILTNSDSPEFLNKAKELGANDYVIKSNLTPKEVVEKITKALNSLDAKGQEA